MNILERIKELCENNGISVNEMAEQTGLSPNSVYKWDKQTPSVDKVERVAKFFGVSLDYLLGHDIPDGDNFTVLGKIHTINAKELRLVKLFNKATENDKKVIEMILAKYDM